MTRISIEDLPIEEDMSGSELKGIFGGLIGQFKPVEQKVQDGLSNTLMIGESLPGQPSPGGLIGGGEVGIIIINNKR